MVVLFMGFLTCLKSRTLATSAIVWNKTNFLLQPAGDSVVIFIKLHDITPIHHHHSISIILSYPLSALSGSDRFCFVFNSPLVRERQSSTNLEYPVWLTLWALFEHFSSSTIIIISNSIYTIKVTTGAPPAPNDWMLDLQLQECLFQ